MRLEDYNAAVARLNMIGREWIPETPENHAAIMSRTGEIWTLMYTIVSYKGQKRGRGISNKQDSEDDIMDALLELMEKKLPNYNPASGDLANYLLSVTDFSLANAYNNRTGNSSRENVIKRSLKTPDSLDAIIDENQDDDAKGAAIFAGNIDVLSAEMQLPGTENSLDEYLRFLPGMVLRFRQLQGNARRGNEEREYYYCLCYTEDITRIATENCLRQYNSADIFTALNQSYLCFFAETDVPCADVAQLSALRLRPVGDVLPGKSRDKRLGFSSDKRFLPAAVPIEYVQSDKNKSISNSRITQMRKDYCDDIVRFMPEGIL